MILIFLFVYFFSVNEKYNKSGITSNINHLQTSVTTTTSKMDSNEPPTKLIKLINGSAILAPMDKDKMLHSGQLTLSQVRMTFNFENFLSKLFTFALGCWWWWFSGESNSITEFITRITCYWTI